MIPMSRRASMQQRNGKTFFVKDDVAIELSVEELQRFGFYALKTYPVINFSEFDPYARDLVEATTVGHLFDSALDAAFIASQDDGTDVDWPTSREAFAPIVAAVLDALGFAVPEGKTDE